MLPSNPGVPRTSGPNATTFLQSLRPDTRPAFLSVRALVMSLGPDVGENVEAGEVTYCRREKPFLRLRAAKSNLALVFPPGLHLPDPSGRLLKRGDEWYVMLESAENLDGHVQEFVRKAYAALR